MKKSTVLFIALHLLLISPIVHAQTSILWEVSGNGTDNKSYLLGSLKFIGEKEYVLHAVIEEKLKTCELFAIEDEVDHHAQHELNKALHFPKGQSLATAMGQEQYQKVQGFFETEFGISKKTFKKRYAPLKPLALSIAMTRLSLHEGLKFYDIELLKLAKELRLETYSLEPIDREAQAFETFAMEEQIAALIHSVDNFEEQKSEYQKLEDAYLKADLDEIFKYSFHPFENNIEFIDEFYHKRNMEWIPKLEKMFTENKAFVAVGVSHLEGDQGLIALLRGKGFTLTPIPVNP